MEYKLIMAVSGFPSLYDNSSPTYRDLNMRSDSWKQVAEIVGVPEFECRRKWKTLRDQHRRERQREKERRESSIGLLNYRPWRYSSILSFLNPFIDSRASGTNGWALDPQPSHLHLSEMVGCSTTIEARSDDDENYGIAVADATTTATSSCSSFSSFMQRKRPSPVSGDSVRLKDAKMEVTSDPDERAPSQQAHVRELFEVMMQSVTAFATSCASSHSPSQPSEQPMPPVMLQPDLQSYQRRQSCFSPLPSSATSRLKNLKKEEQDDDMREIADLTDDDQEEDDCGAVPPRTTRVRRKNSDVLLENFLRRMEAREVHRDRDVDPRDDVTLFLLSLAPAMRRLCAEKQSWVRTKIQQLLHEAEFGATHF